MASSSQYLHGHEVALLPVLVAVVQKADSSSSVVLSGQHFQREILQASARLWEQDLCNWTARIQQLRHDGMGTPHTVLSLNKTASITAASIRGMPQFHFLLVKSCDNEGLCDNLLMCLKGLSVQVLGNGKLYWECHDDVTNN